MGFLRANYPRHGNRGLFAEDSPDFVADFGDSPIYDDDVPPPGAFEEVSHGDTGPTLVVHHS